MTYRCDRQQVKHLRAISPCIQATILLLAFFVESVYLCDLATFVVAAQQCDSVWPSRFERHQVCKRFQAMISSIYKIALCGQSWNTSLPYHKNVIRVRQITTRSKQLQ